MRGPLPSLPQRPRRAATQGVQYGEGDESESSASGSAGPSAPPAPAASTSRLREGTESPPPVDPSPSSGRLSASGASGGRSVSPAATDSRRQAVVSLSRLPSSSGSSRVVPPEDDGAGPSSGVRAGPSSGARPKLKRTATDRKRKASAVEDDDDDEPGDAPPKSKKKRIRIRAKPKPSGPEHRPALQVKKTISGFQARGPGGRFSTVFPKTGVRDLNHAIELKMVRLPDEVVRLRELNTIADHPDHPLRLRRFALMHETLKALGEADLSLHLPTSIPGELLLSSLFLFFFRCFWSGLHRLSSVFFFCCLSMS